MKQKNTFEKDIKMTKQKLEWDNALTNTQRENLARSVAQSLTELVNTKEVRDLAQEVYIGETDESSLYLTPQGRLKEFHSYLSSDWCGWTRETFEMDVTNSNYCELAKNYKLTTQEIEELRRKLEA